MYKPENFDKNIINWKRCLSLASYQPGLAEELLTLFISQLPQELASLSESIKEDNILRYLELTHKLYGGCCYCAVPELKAALLALESKPRESITLAALKAHHPRIIQSGLRLVLHYKAVSDSNAKSDSHSELV